MLNSDELNPDRPQGHSLPTPELAPLVVGSQEARALHDLWTGSELSQVVLQDPDDRLKAAVTIAAHLAVRADLRVVLLVPSVQDRAPAVVGLSEQIPHRLIACDEFDSATIRLPAGWVPTVLASGKGVMVRNRPLFGADVAVVALDHREGTSPMTRRCSGVRFVHVAGTSRLEDSPTADSLGDIPLDVVLAGGPVS